MTKTFKSQEVSCFPVVKFYGYEDFGYEVEGQLVTWPSMNLSFVRMLIQSLSSGEQIGVVPGFA